MRNEMGNYWHIWKQFFGGEEAIGKLDVIIKRSYKISELIGFTKGKLKSFKNKNCSFPINMKICLRNNKKK